MDGHVYYGEPVFMQNLAADKDVQDEKKRKKEEKMRLKNKKKLAKKAKQNQAEDVM